MAYQEVPEGLLISIPNTEIIENLNEENKEIPNIDMLTIPIKFILFHSQIPVPFSQLIKWQILVSQFTPS